MKISLLLGFSLALSPALYAAASLAGSGILTQNFNTLPVSAGTDWVDNTTLPNWYLFRSNATAPVPVPVLVNDNVAASAWTPGLYSLGATGSTERSLGSAPTGVLGEFSHVLIVQNTNALPVRITNIAYKIEKWRENSTVGIVERFDFSYKKAADEAGLIGTPGADFINEDILDVSIPHSGTASAIHNPGIVFPVSQAPATPLILAAGEFAALRWLNSNESGSDAYLGMDDLAITYVMQDCAIEATPHNLVRDTKNTAPVADDTFAFSMTVSGAGTVSPSGWELASALPAGWSGPLNGAYGDEVTYSGVPVTGATVSLVLRDRSNAACTRTVIVNTPPVPATLTNTSGPLEVRFTAPAAGSTSFTRSYTDGLSDLSWSSGVPANGFNGVSTRPGGGDANKYFRLRNFKLPRFQTEPVDIGSVAGFEVSIRLAAYTTSGSGFEDLPAAAPTFAASDRIQVLGEASEDGVNWFAAAPNLVDPGQTAVSQFAEFRIANPGTGYTPDGVTPSTLPATMPFPATRLLRFTRGTARYVRLVVLGGNDSDTENLLFDDLKIAIIPPVITATPSNVTRNNQGDDNPANDTFTFSLAINNTQPGREDGWTSSEAGFTGSYGTNPISFPDYPVSGGPHTITFSDIADPSVTLSYTVPVPTGVLTLGVVTPVRNEGATLDPGDDTWSFAVVINGVNGGTGYLNNRNAVSTDFGMATTFGPFPVSAGAQAITFQDRSNNAWTVSGNFAPPIRPVVSTLATGGPLKVIYSDVSPVITGWVPGPSQGILVQNNGGGTESHVFRSDPVNLSGVTGPVRFNASLTAADTSAGTNFESNDTFKIELELTGPAGTSLINLLTPLQDTGDGASSLDVNGPPNQVLNGFTGTNAADYDANRERDEFNLTAAAAGETFTSHFHFTALIPDEITAARVIVSGLNNSASETFTVSGLNFTLETNSTVDSDSDGAGLAAEIAAGTDPSNPNDVLRLGTFTVTPDSNPRTFTSSFPGKSGRFYRLYHSSDLQTWNAEGTTYNGNGAEINVTTVTTNLPRLYYRLMVSTSDNFPTVTP